AKQREADALAAKQKQVDDEKERAQASAAAAAAMTIPSKEDEPSASPPVVPVVATNPPSGRGRSSYFNPQISFEQFDDDEEEYEVKWEQGMLGLYFGKDDVSGLPVVRRIHVHLSQCRDIRNVRVHDLLLQVGAKRLGGHETLRQTLEYLGSIPKPVVMVFQRNGHETAHELADNEFEVLWGKNEPLKVSFRMSMDHQMPFVSNVLSQVFVPTAQVRSGDLLTHINDKPTLQKSQVEVNRMLTQEPKPCVLRFRRLEPGSEPIPRSHRTSYTDYSSTKSLAETMSFAGSVGSSSSFRGSNVSVMTVPTQYSITWQADDGPLGLVIAPRLENYIEVVQVKDEGAAYAARQRHQVSKGDLMLYVNHDDIRDLGFQRAMHILKTAPKPLVLTFQKGSSQPPPPSTNTTGYSCRSLVADDKWLVRLHIAFSMDTVLPRMEGSDAAHVLGAFAEVLDDAFAEFGVARELLLLALVCDEAAWITHHLALLAEKQQDYDQATTSTTPICVVFSTNNRVMALRLVDQAAAVEQCVANLLPDLVETTARRVVQRYKLTAAAVVQHMPDLCRPVTCKQDFDSLAPLMGLLYYLNGDTDAAMALWAAYIRRLANIHSPEYAFAGYCTGMVLHVADRRPAATKAIKKAFTVDAHSLQYQNVDLVLREAAHPPSNVVSTEHGDRRRLRALTCNDWTSGCMRQQVMMEEGAPVWVMHAARWNVAVIQSISQHGTISCCLVDTPALVEVDATARKDNIHPCNPVEQHRSGVDDLTTLVHLHEPAILNTLRVRYRNDQIYTRAGTILVAVNPFQSLDLYDDATQRRYIHAGRTRRDGDSVLAPHVFQVADRAYHEMLSTRHNQSILVSGESGAGKTETTKLIMTYLASVSSSRADNAVRDRILESTPILEAFGNAMTTRNSNSSRFGKFIRLGFDAASGELVGASIATYLLERVRLISHGVGERNYHIFYELCASPASKSLLGLDRSFAYLESSIMGHRSRRDGVDDAAQFEVTHHAMTTIGLSNHNIASVLQVVAAVLHLGNLEFVPVQGGTSCRLSYDDDTTRFCSSLLGIAYDHMQEALTTRRIKAGGDVVTVGLSPDAAAHSRDVVAKSMYARLFEWLVGRINAATSSPTTSTLHLIGVVDIFGFESFATNSLEQLCINYANEKLQQLFTKYVFELEQREYVAEGIPWTLVAYPNNDACVTLFESRPHGLFSLLDEQCMIPRGNDKQLLATMHGKLSSPFTSSRAQLGKGQFTVCHYAGPVVYSTDGFCDKNKDNVHPEALEFLNLSSHDLLHTTNESPPPHHHHPRHANSRRVSAKERASTSCIQKFQGQLKALLGELDTSELHFIRCIKPNDLGRPHVVDDARFLDQLRCSGLLEVTELTRLRHPVRMSHSLFLKQFRCLFPTTSTDRNDVARMLRHWGVASPVVGVSKVYFDHALLTHLLQARELRVRVAVRTLHRFAAALAHRRQTLRRLRLQAATRTVCRAMLDTIHRRRTVRVVQAAHAQRVIAWAWKCYRHAMHHKRYMEAAEHNARQEQRVMVACHALQTWVRRCQLRQALVRHARQLTTATTATAVLSSTRPSDYLRDFGTPPRHPLPYVNTLVSTKNSIMSHWDVARDTSSTSSSSMDAGDDSTYEITWECG
ncbi:hypothetical protein DYB34_009470, partial [Aphanomyces astaci]